MARVTVYRGKSYDISTDRMIVSRRLFTIQGAKVAGVELIKGSEVEIDSGDLEGSDGWWTPVDYRAPSVG
jgi:hypothetical protein